MPLSRRVHSDLQQIYGTLPMPTSEMPTPARTALAAYRARLAAPGDVRPVVVAWAPGRINLSGEHPGYCGGWSVPGPVGRVVALAGRATNEGGLRRPLARHEAWARAAGGREEVACGAPGALPAWAPPSPAPRGRRRS